MTHTESFGRGRIAESILANATPPFTLNVSKVPVGENQFITINPDTTNEEIFFYTTTTGTIGEAGSIDITERGYNVFDRNTDTGNQRQHDENVEYKLALNHIIINEKVDTLDDTIIQGDITFSNTLKTGFNGLNKLTTAERDALTGVNNGAMIYNTDTNVIQQRISGAWTDVGNTGTPDASEIVAGKVEMATTAEYQAGTDVGSTGAPLVAKPSDIQDSLPEAASETVAGLSERATDAEALAKTDTTRYISPNQLGLGIGDSIAVPTARSNGVIYQATSGAGFIVGGGMSPPVNQIGNMSVEIGSSNPPSTVYYSDAELLSNTMTFNFNVPVPKDWYYRINYNNVAGGVISFFELG